MKLFLSEEKTNLGRQREFDYAKVIAIVFMVLMSPKDISTPIRKIRHLNNLFHT